MTTLALSIIVRNAATLLPACLESARGAVQEIVIADTASTDETIATASALGARVFSIPWNDDFSQARNLALAEVHSDWVLVLDADEQLDPSAAQKIPLLLDAGVDGYQVPIRNYVVSLEERLWDRPAKPNDSTLPAAQPYPAYVEHQNVRLFRRHPDLYFVGRVHESVGPRVLQTGRKLGEAPFCIHHFGLVAAKEVRAQKNHFYRRLGREKIREMPRNAQAHLELGLVELDNFQNLTEALSLFARACQLDKGLGVAWFFRGVTLVKLKRFEEALGCLAEAERNGNATSLLAETQGDVYYNLKDFTRAAESYSRALRFRPQSPVQRSKLGLSLVRSGDVEPGLRQIRCALAAKPATAELHDRLILALVFLDRLEDAAQAAQAKLGVIAAPAPTDFLRAASLWAKAQDFPRAAAMLQVGLQLHPGDPVLSQALAEIARSAGINEFVTTMESNT
jgi:glycosyltransferase involved in cell wall biosynthesis